MAHQSDGKKFFFQPGKLPIKLGIQTLPPCKNEFLLRQKYCQEMFSTRQISEQFFSARSTIVANLKTFGVPLRKEDEPQRRRRGQIAYGQRMVKGVIVENKAELANLEKMINLKNQGHSYHDIAKALNMMGIKTKTRSDGMQRPS